MGWFWANPTSGAKAQVAPRSESTTPSVSSSCASFEVAGLSDMLTSFISPDAQCTWGLIRLPPRHHPEVHLPRRFHPALSNHKTTQFGRPLHYLQAQHRFLERRHLLHYPNSIL